MGFTVITRRPLLKLAGALARAGTLTLVICAAAAASGARAAAAGATTVDGISDQSLPNWDGGFDQSAFAARFRETWRARGGISYARYVLQWNAFADRAEEPYAHYASEFERWWEDARTLHLTPVVAFYNYCPPMRVPRACAAALPNPRNETEYRSAIEAVLSRFPAPVVEAWNEPNDDEVSEAQAAQFMDVAFGWCAKAGCTPIAGDFLDARGAARYAAQYAKDLDGSYGAQITEWGVHPYHAVNRAGEGGEALAIRATLGTRVKHLWITEIGAYYCDQGALLGEREQQARAERLVDEVAPQLQASHAFYYELLRGDRARPPCEAGGTQEDSALYRPDDVARAAANVILDGSWTAAPVPAAAGPVTTSAPVVGAAPSAGPTAWSGFAEALA
jgi:hypothetical protein